MPSNNHHRFIILSLWPCVPSIEMHHQIVLKPIILTGSVDARNMARVHFLCADQISFDMTMRYAVANLRSLHTYSDIATLLTLRIIRILGPQIIPTMASLQKWGSQAKMPAWRTRSEVAGSSARVS